MSLLVTILVPLAISSIIVIILLFLEPAEPRRPREAPPNWKEEPFSALSIEQAFDPDQAIIWDTQVPALRLIASAGREGLAMEALYHLYTRSSRQYPELYEGSSFETWLEFLEYTGLISEHLGTASLTPEGQQFLQYRVTAAALVAGHQARLASHRTVA